MDPNHKHHQYPLNYSEDVAPKYPDVQSNQAGLEVVPDQSPIYPAPTYAALLKTTFPYNSSQEWGDPSPALENSHSPAVSQWSVDAEVPARREKHRILGLTTPVFWAVIAAIVVILAAAVGGGVGAGLAAQQKSTASSSRAGAPTSTTPADSTTTTTTTTTSPPGTATTVAANGPVPTDGGCPLIDGQRYTPYAVDGKPIPLGAGLVEGQQFEQQCYTNYAASSAAETHDILRIFMPDLETCMMTCAEYNSAYRAGLQGNAGVGGGYCVAVSLTKQEAGFCRLKNGTALNDTLGSPESYSSAVLLTDLDLNDTTTITDSGR
ncbi:hypothetical protein F4778DRAFT_407915 [Xylariomycetidae sp. FL2044]|nr:hypothetical protein F4778DRAFT_788623 [Xylariomycetidae sp. FL2044]KAH9883396.1 hypothetical protein F4778DRAFT_788626 [Xylariomycetidae sp. FL2044]KAH9883430.1 hypothetical protein F4778DRAFT_801951 [Xylariomycetidae sp. FL2044]KAH9883433.1 hypothetical protein F4778DRAFT_801957 [Xylariomycetidae sp. FL2044]KAH9883441.1 hypothetical protein F4778DRAFT_801938 [Xylariomycetidae sp. FL2044]